MTGSAYTQPLPLPAAGWRRRLEVFSPKLARRLSLGSYDAQRCWFALEASPELRMPELLRVAEDFERK